MCDVVRRLMLFFASLQWSFTNDHSPVAWLSINMAKNVSNIPFDEQFGISHTPNRSPSSFSITNPSGGKSAGIVGIAAMARARMRSISNRVGVCVHQYAQSLQPRRLQFALR